MQTQVSKSIRESTQKLLGNFLSNKFQRLAINGLLCNWLPVKAGLSQSSVLGALFVHIYIYINSLPKCIISKVKLFADGTSILSVVYDSKIPASELITT